MLNLKNDKNEINFNKLNNKNLEIDQIINDLNKYLCIHIKKQIEAGADVVQIFDSWAGIIPEKDINYYCFLPNLEIVKFCKNLDIPNICFPKGIGERYKDFKEIVKPDCISLDSEVDPMRARNNLKNVIIQGGLDPKVLFRSDDEIFKAATKYIQTFKDTPYIFNLGHGLLPETDPDKVDKLIKFYRNFNG